MLTVASVFVRGEYPYTVEYVRRLRAMVRRWLDRPFRFVCLTDQPELMPSGVDAIDVQPPDGCYAFWTKVQLFNPALGFTDRVLFLDLDSLIVAPLDPIVDYPSAFVLASDCFADQFAGDRAVGVPRKDEKDGRTLWKKFQGSIMLWTAGAHADLYEAWTPEVAQRLYTDQDWVGERYPHASALPLSWTPRISQVQPPWPADAKIVFCKKPKNIEALQRWPELEYWWGDGVMVAP